MKDAVAALFERALDQLIADNIINSVDRKPVHIENTRDPAHGDLATNVAMMHAKAAQIAPRALAEKLIEHLPASEAIEAVEIAGPGFINVRLAKGAAFEPVVRCLTERDQFGLHPTTKERVQVEYVSANPTGPLHVGHGRGAAYGATLVNLLKARGHQVEAEYYVNDAGRQMNILAVSVYLRYLETTGEAIVFPSAGYQGQYIAELGDLDDIQDDLSEFGANFDQWFSEKSLVTSGEIDQAIATLEERGYLFEQDGALWFRSTDFGDDKDRVVRRDNGETTYFASDIAYIANKFSRGFDRIIYVWGADHHGYIVRIKAAAEALGFDPERLTIRLVQFAILYKEGERLQMSTRSGSFVTLRELRDDVGRDACRYFYVMRKADQHLDFDLSLATSQTKDNPVYYVQYAHARICRVLEGLNEIPFDASRGLNHLTELTTQDELDLATAVGRSLRSSQKHPIHWRRT